eukprot:TRINITY_DN615_c2_g1_i1.p1 TRINITY_DN615_c2_g1~~TRINITY_DN615_c2_g1_i1.p1  ORF type:complete len:963 (+),score=180.33 TRINITY_DN615_c2_g1_i1:127-2889(+)
MPAADAMPAAESATPFQCVPNAAEAPGCDTTPRQRYSGYVEVHSDPETAERGSGGSGGITDERCSKDAEALGDDPTKEIPGGAATVGASCVRGTSGQNRAGHRRRKGDGVRFHSVSPEPGCRSFVGILHDRPHDEAVAALDTRRQAQALECDDPLQVSPDPRQLAAGSPRVGSPAGAAGVPRAVGSPSTPGTRSRTQASPPPRLQRLTLRRRCSSLRCELRRLQQQAEAEAEAENRSPPLAPTVTSPVTPALDRQRRGGPGSPPVAPAGAAGAAVWAAAWAAAADSPDGAAGGAAPRDQSAAAPEAAPAPAAPPAGAGAAPAAPAAGQDAHGAPAPPAPPALYPLPPLMPPGVAAAPPWAWLMPPPGLPFPGAPGWGVPPGTQPAVQMGGPQQLPAAVAAAAAALAAAAPPPAGAPPAGGGGGPDAAAQQRRGTKKCKFSGWEKVCDWDSPDAGNEFLTFGSGTPALVYHVGDTCPQLRSLWDKVLCGGGRLPPDVVPLVLSFVRAGSPAPVRVAERAAVGAVDRNRQFWTQFVAAVRSGTSGAGSGAHGAGRREARAQRMPPHLLRTYSYRRPKDRDKDKGGEDDARRRPRKQQGRWAYLFREVVGPRIAHGQLSLAAASRATGQVVGTLLKLDSLSAPLVCPRLELLFAAAVWREGQNTGDVKLLPQCHEWQPQEPDAHHSGASPLQLPQAAVLRWCAPEQLEAYKSTGKVPTATRQSVVWSLGVLAYELARGSLPYQPQTLDEAIAWGTHHEFRERKLRCLDEAPPELRSFVDLCLRPVQSSSSIGPRPSLHELAHHKWLSVGGGCRCCPGPQPSRLLTRIAQLVPRPNGLVHWLAVVIVAAAYLPSVLPRFTQQMVQRMRRVLLRAAFILLVKEVCTMFTGPWPPRPVADLCRRAATWLGQVLPGGADDTTLSAVE